MTSSIEVKPSVAEEAIEAAKFVFPVLSAVAAIKMFRCNFFLKDSFYIIIWNQLRFYL